MLTLGGYNFTISSTKFWKQRGGSSYCELLAYEAEGDNWVLGANFLQDYFVVINYDRMQVKITGQGISGHREERYHNSRDNSGWIVAGILLGLIVVAVIGLWCYRRCKQQGRETHVELHELADRSSQVQSSAINETSPMTSHTKSE